MLLCNSSQSNKHKASQSHTDFSGRKELFLSGEIPGQAQKVRLSKPDKPLSPLVQENGQFQEVSRLQEHLHLQYILEFRMKSAHGFAQPDYIFHQALP